MEEGSSVESHRRRFFRSSSAVDRGRRNLPWDSMEEPSSVVIMSTAKEGSSVESHRRFLPPLSTEQVCKKA